MKLQNPLELRIGKRAFDICFSVLALVCGLPLFILLALLVKTSKGPIFYPSTRLGHNGRTFTFWKFRSMYPHAENQLQEILAKNPELREEWKTFLKLKKDPRVTPIGKFLRKTSLDELPQFWNVLLGELSIVGPRPYLPRELGALRRILGKDAEKLFSVRPGLTGIWQTSGRSLLSFEARVRLDIRYIEEGSLLMDLGLVAKTIPSMLFSKGAY